MESRQLSETLASHWGEILEGVRKAANLSTDVAYNTWLVPMEFASYNKESEVLTINLPENLMHMTEYLHTQFGLHIQVLCAELVGASSRPEIVFQLKPEFEEAPLPVPAATEESATPSIDANLNPRYRFDTFVVGNNNNFAHSACLAVAETPGRAYNPLFLYGGPGLGKTHLMHSIAHMMIENRPASKVLYVTSEQFTNEVIESIRSNRADRMTRLREKYRTVDVLMVDDVQFIIGKEATQDEFFHTFNALHQAGKQIVISSDRPPRDIETLEERLRSRFEMGLIADIQPPNYETRMAILRKNAENAPFPIDDRVFEYIAENITSNIRELEGAYNKIIAHAGVHQGELTLEEAQNALKDIVDPVKNNILSIERIVDAVCAQYQISREEIISKKRVAEIVLPRQVSMFLCRKLLTTPLEDIGDFFGGKDHSTVMSSVKKIQALLETDDTVRMNLAQIEQKLGV